jgi:GABA(A) receptor-associated protein
MSYKSKVSFIERKMEVTNILQKYPDRIPIICEKNKKSKSTPEIDKNKYLVPNDLIIGQFMYVIRRRLNIGHEQAIYLFINGYIPSTSCYISDIYENYKEQDGYLYITYSCENTFG